MTIEIIVIADAPPISGGASQPTHPSLAEKQMFRDVADTLTVGAAAMGLTGSLIGLAGPELWGPSAYALVLSAGMAIGAVGFNRLANDPPDPDFEQPVALNLLTMKTHGNLRTPQTVGATTVFNRLLPAAAALLSGYERAQGAEAAGDTRWQLGHLQGVHFMREAVLGELDNLATVLDRKPGAVISQTTLNPPDYAAAQQAAAAHRLLPPAVQDMFLTGGLAET